jgi:hypothetical protein
MAHHCVLLLLGFDLVELLGKLVEVPSPEVLLGRASQLEQTDEMTKLLSQSITQV